MKPTKPGITRRALAGAPLAAASLALPAPGQRRKVIDEDDPANLKIGHILNWNVSDDFLLFCKQIGLKWARLMYHEDPSVDKVRAVQKRFESYGIRIYSGCHYAYRSLRVQLGQPGRDQDIETHQRFIRTLGKLGIPQTNYDFHPANTYTTSYVENRGYKARQFSVKEFREKIEKPAFDREYSAEDIWATYTYFMKAVLPVAEEANVIMALHPDDPPLAKMNGVAKLFVHYDGYKRAEQIAGNSKHWGLRLCVGTWMEGGDQMGKDTLGMIHDFGSRGKLFDIDFRNVSSPLPVFFETFPDDGYTDMYQLVKALRQVKYRWGIVPDHIPQLAGDGPERRAGLAYCISYFKALLRRANEEVG
ncbi:MAG: mannonate dehydratase [Bryobacterales bacterium]|nr:mannonate dehydratase [Bryobacterales bacterium]